jgi:hypothetical protein
MHDGISFDKTLPKQVGYLENREFRHNARSATSWISFASTPLSVLHSASESVHIFIKNVQKIKLTDTYDD